MEAFNDTYIKASPEVVINAPRNLRHIHIRIVCCAVNVVFVFFTFHHFQRFLSNVCDCLNLCVFYLFPICNRINRLRSCHNP